MLSRTVLRSARAAPCRSFSSTAVASQAPIPPATKPASQSQPSLAPVPKTQLEQIRQYPAHPLLQFFRTQRFQITNKALGGPVAVEEQAGDAVSGSKSYVEMPQALLRSDLGKHGHSRSWLASELRLKSSADLHTLWYVLLMERNRLATAWEEVRRVGARPHARLFNQNLSQKNHRNKKSMARVKLVLNERRLALISAQEQVRSGLSVDDAEAAEPSGSLFEDEPPATADKRKAAKTPKAAPAEPKATPAEAHP